MRIGYFGEQRVDIREYDAFLQMCKEAGVEPVLTCGEGHIIIARRGEKNVHHFAHKASTLCSCSDNKGEWHIWFQDRCIKEGQEVRLKEKSTSGQEILHIADVLIPREKIPNTVLPSNVKGYVLEIQHSPMDERTMRERERFYTLQGYHLVWVFDCIKWETQQVRRLNGTPHLCTTDESYKPIELTIRRKRGPDFPILGKYTDNVTKIFDFNKNNLFVVTKQVGASITGYLISLEEFDRKYLGTYTVSEPDTRPFHHNL